MSIIANDFIEPFAGQPAYTPINEGKTYSRILNAYGIRVPFDTCIQSIRERSISHKSYNNDYYRDIWIEHRSPEWWGLYFQTLQRDDRTELTNHAYTLEKIGKPLAELTGVPMQDLQHQCNSYGMNYLVNRYFDGVESPEEGDLVVYYNQSGKAVHSGIYHTYSKTWRTVGNGTVESRWSDGVFGNPYVFQHNLFLIPSHFGDIAKFYRVKKTLAPSTFPVKHNGDPMYEAKDGSFHFVQSVANKNIRSHAGSLSTDRLVQIYPQIECVSDINFFGVCFMYAMDKIFKSRYASVQEKTPVREYDLCGSGKSEFLERYFTSVSTPKVGDLAVYSRSSGYRTHFGVYIGDDLIESKWGSLPVFRHPPFYVDNDCGDTLTYYRLNKELENEKTGQIHFEETLSD